jgi:hypothetical protein
MILSSLLYNGSSSCIKKLDQTNRNPRRHEFWLILLISDIQINNTSYLITILI